jgi:hypothetical protein
MGICLISGFGFSGNAQIKISTNGNVGFGGHTPDDTYDLYSGSGKFSGNALFNHSTYPSYIFENGFYIKVFRPTVNHTCTLGTSSYYFDYIYADGASFCSDVRIKENIRSVINGLEIIKNLKPIKYDLIEEITYQPDVEYSTRERQFKEKMRKDKYGFSAQDMNEFIPEIVVYDDTADVYGIEYIDLIPILTKAIQEQQQQIEEQSEDIVWLQKQLVQLQKDVGQSKSLSSSK